MTEICLSSGWFFLWTWLCASVGAILGFFLCAILTMSKRADEAMASFGPVEPPQSAGSKDTQD